MIIKRIIAENLLKYRRLSITDLPASGQIAVAGANEAGKTAIGETICFALFGRTFSLGPSEVSRVIRWSEFAAKVLLEFTGADGATYAVTRQIDNNGRISAKLHRAGDSRPLSEDVAEVDRLIREIIGFGYRSFVDSFYLAQREMEVPHAKSDTVKALIGVDRLEAIASEFEAEAVSLGEEMAALHEQVGACREAIAEVGLDRAFLGRLETKRDEAMRLAERCESQAQKAGRRAEGIGAAVRTFAKSSEMFVTSTLESTFGEWHSRRERMSSGLAAASKATRESHAQVDGSVLSRTRSVVEDFERGLSEFQKVRDLAGLYGHRLRHLLNEGVSDVPALPDGLALEADGERRFADRRASVIRKIDAAQQRRRPLFGFGIFFGEVALLAAGAWAVHTWWPESSLGGWLGSALGLGGTMGVAVCLLVGVLAALSAVVLFSRYRQTGALLRRYDLELENIEAASQDAREEIAIIEAIDEAALPDALAALERLQNPLLKSAVHAFVDGSGAVLVQPGALEEKLEQIRRLSGQGVKSLKQARDRLVSESESLKAEALEHHGQVVEIERALEEERERWDAVESLERKLAGIEARVSKLREEQRTRRTGCELIDGACRRIYSRFHPELRRFIGRILPELTAQRYEHLEMDDDLRVRVYCKQKNDFVGLDEISNGTHRQLMLCVRLALSQALIASSSKSDQFIFFDEPFVFFDEERMARAIDVLGKISPQITQVWLAAQTFADRDRFDMVIDCDPGGDVLTAGGEADAAKRGRGRKASPAATS